MEIDIPNTVQCMDESEQVQDPIHTWDKRKVPMALCFRHAMLRALDGKAIAVILTSNGGSRCFVCDKEEIDRPIDKG